LEKFEAAETEVLEFAFPVLLTESFDIPEASSEVIDVIFRKLFKALKKERNLNLYSASFSLTWLFERSFAKAKQAGLLLHI
jgi:hypothetical protein